MSDAGARRDTALSDAFDDAWVEWLALWHNLQFSTQAEEPLVERAAQEATLLARRLARTALAHTGAAAGKQVDIVQFVFVALLDENLLFTPWPGQVRWQNAPLEYRLFGTRTAGERIPDEIERLLRERDPALRDLAHIYLQSLLLGFHGRLRGGGAGRAQHEAWRRALFAFVWQRDPEYPQLARMLERPAAIAPLRLPVRRILPDGFRLGIIIALIVLGMTGIGHLFWLDIAHRIQPGLYALGDDGGLQ